GAKSQQVPCGYQGGAALGRRWISPDDPNGKVRPTQPRLPVARDQEHKYACSMLTRVMLTCGCPFRFEPKSESSLTYNHDSIARRLNMRLFIRRLIPGDPFFVDRETRYSVPIPRATKYWCIIALALNAAVSVVATVVTRSLAPILIACMASLFPEYMLMF